MKKVLSILVVFCMLFCLSACKKNDMSSEASSNTSKSDIVTSQADDTNLPEGDITSSEVQSSEETVTTPEETEEPTESLKPQSSEHKHTYTENVIKKATCTEKGSKTVTCDCGYSAEKVVSANGHSWGKWKTVKKATTTAKGKSQRVCSVCQAVDNKSIPKLTPSKDEKITVTKSQIQKIEDKFFELVNAERKRCGVSPLAFNKYLDGIAEIRSEELITFFNHMRPNGESFESIVDDNIYPYTICGENICETSHVGRDYYTPSDKWVGSNAQIESAASWIFKLFKLSAPHYAAMTDEEYKECGIGISCVVDEKTNIPMFKVAHVFGTRED